MWQLYYVLRPAKISWTERKCAIIAASKSNIMKNVLSSIRLSYILILLAAILLALTPFKIVSFLILIFVLARTVVLRFGLIGNMLIAFLLIAATSSAVAAGTWLVDIPISPAWLLGSYAACLLLSTQILPDSWRPLRPSRSEIFDKDDWIGLLIVGLFSISLLSVLGNPLSAAQLGSVIMKGGDNSAHFNLLKLNDINHGFAIGSDNKVNAHGPLQTYPQGWHYNGALLKQIIEPLVPIQISVVRLLAFYYLLCCLWFVTLIFLIIRLGLYLLRGLSKGSSTAWLAGALAGIAGAVALGYALVSPFIIGFQSQISALALLVLEVILLLFARQARLTAQKFALLLLAAIALAGSSFSWLYLLPIGGGLLAFVCWQTIRETKRLPLVFAAMALPIGGAILFQPLVQILIKIPPYKDGIINQPGYVEPLDIYLVIALFVAATITYVIYRKDKLVQTLYGACVLACLFSFGIMMYQLETVHELRYYFYKSLVTCVALTTPLIAAGIARLVLFCLRETDRKRTIILGSLTVLLGIFLWFGWRSPYLTELPKGVYGISPAQADALRTIIDENPANADHIVSIGGCNRGEDARTGQLATALSYHPPFFQFSPFQVLLPDEQEIFSSMHDFMLKYDFQLIVLVNDQQVGERLEQYMSDVPPDLLRIVTLDGTPETEPIQQCPDRIR